MGQHVADKFKPVKTDARSHTPWGRVVLGAWLAAAILGFYASEGVVRQVSAARDGTTMAGLLGPAEAVQGAADAVGATTLRHDVEGLFDPLMHTGRLWQAPVEHRPGPATIQAAAPPPPEALPGERYVHPASPQARRPRRILLVGASSVQYYLGIALEEALESTYTDIEVVRLGKLGTGLVRDDVFDWPARIDELLALHRPDVVITQFGGKATC